MKSNRFKNKGERMQDKKNTLIQQFNQLRLELGDVTYRQKILESRSVKLGNMLSNLQAEYEKLEKASPTQPVKQDAAELLKTLEPETAIETAVEAEKPAA